MNPRDYDDVDNVMEESLALAALGAVLGALSVFAALMGAIVYLLGR